MAEEVLKIERRDNFVTLTLNRAEKRNALNVALMKALDEAEVIAVLNTLVKQRKDSAEQFRNGGRTELAEKEEAEIKIIEEYLPAAASEDDIRGAIEEAVQETGAASIKDMGKVMKATMVRLSGKTADGSKVSQLVKEKLS